jgi:hypothetical protein
MNNFDLKTIIKDFNENVLLNKKDYFEALINYRKQSEGWIKAEFIKYIFTSKYKDNFFPEKIYTKEKNYKIDFCFEIDIDTFNIELKMLYDGIQNKRKISSKSLSYLKKDIEKLFSLESSENIYNYLLIIIFPNPFYNKKDTYFKNSRVKIKDKSIYDILNYAKIYTNSSIKEFYLSLIKITKESDN